MEENKLSQSSMCQICGTEFSWYWNHRHSCGACGKTVCDKCSEKYIGSIELCTICFQNYSGKLDSVIIIKSSHVGNHNTIRNIKNISTAHFYKNYDEAKEELILQCLILGGNAVLSTKFETQKKEDGNYIYKVHRGHGVASVVEKRVKKNNYFCSHCGNNLDVNANFCSKCGRMAK